MKAENTSLKATIAAIEQRLSAFEKANDLDSEWKEYYAKYTIKLSNESKYNYFNYENNRLYFHFEDNSVLFYLIIFCDNDGKKHFLEINNSNGYGCYNRLYNPQKTFSENEYPPFDVVNLNVTQNQDIPYYALYSKPEAK